MVNVECRGGRVLQEEKEGCGGGGTGIGVTEISQ